ncbi:MAG: biopolymer transporter ExbD [Phycisphaeraceae bacterium]|nr:biopolymer transporter ExbD [Phycisphaeraceae bacterium]
MRRHRDPRHVEGPNLAPMVDVVLVILIFFMASVAFVGPEWFLPAALPAAPLDPSTAKADPYALPDPTLRVRVSMVDDRPVVMGLGPGTVTLASFEAHAREQLQGIDIRTIRVRLGGDSGTTWQHVVAVQDVLTRHGVRQISLESP